MRSDESALIRAAARLAICGALALGLPGLPTTATAGGIKLMVSATILKYTSVSVLTQPSSVVVTQADISRGYVDAAVPARIAIKSNTAGGYLLEFVGEGDFIRQILVRGLDNDVQLSPSGGFVMQTSKGSGMTRTTLDLRFRFVLAEAAMSGTYAWPMHLSVTPL